MQALDKLHKWISERLVSFVEWAGPHIHPDAAAEATSLPWEDHQRQLPNDGAYWFCYKYPYDKCWVGPLLVEVKNGAFGEIPHIGAGHWFLKARDYQNGTLLARWRWTYKPKPPTE